VGTFEEFLDLIDQELPTQARGLALALGEVTTSLPVDENEGQLDLSESCRSFLQVDVDVVGDMNVTEPVEGARFYRGMHSGWAPIEQNLDAKRSLCDTILVDHVLAAESDRLGRLELVLVKGHAGAGKSVLLRRIAWDAANDYGCVCLYLRNHGVIDVASLQE